MKKLVLLSRADKKAIREANQAISLQNKQISQEIQEEKENQGISIREKTDENLSQHDEDFGNFGCVVFNWGHMKIGILFCFIPAFF